MYECKTCLVSFDIFRRNARGEHADCGGNIEYEYEEYDSISCKRCKATMVWKPEHSRATTQQPTTRSIPMNVFDKTNQVSATDAVPTNLVSRVINLNDLADSMIDRVHSAVAQMLATAEAKSEPNLFASLIDSVIGKDLVRMLLSARLTRIPGCENDERVLSLAKAMVADHDDAAFNILFLAVYANEHGTPNRVSAFISSTENEMFECPIWDNVDFDDEDQIEAIIAKLNELVQRYHAKPLQVRAIFAVPTCGKCKKASAVMVWCEERDGELTGRIRNACCACKTPGEFIG